MMECYFKHEKRKLEQWILSEEFFIESLFVKNGAGGSLCCFLSSLFVVFKNSEENVIKCYFVMLMLGSALIYLWNELFIIINSYF